MNTAETQKSFRKPSSDTPISKENVLSQFNTLKAHLATLEKISNKCNEDIHRMGLQKTRPKNNSKKDIKADVFNPNPTIPVDELILKLEQFKQHLKEREECLHVDLTFLKKETGIDLSSPPLLLENEKNIKTPSSLLPARKEPVEEHKLDSKEIQKRQALFNENKNIQQKIIKLKHLLESRGESTKKTIGPIVNLNKKSDSLGSLATNNKLLKDQFQLVSSLLNKVETKRKTKSIPLSKPEKPGEIPDAQKQELKAQKKSKEIHQENVKIHQEIVRLKELLKSFGEEIGPIVNLNKKTDSLDSLDKTNKLLKDQIQLASSLLNKAEIERKTKNVACPKPEKPLSIAPQNLNNKEEVKQNSPKHSSDNHLDLQTTATQKDKDDSRHHPQSQFSPLKIAKYLRNGLLSPSILLPEESQILEYKAWDKIFSHGKLSEIGTIYCAFLNTTGGRLLLGVDEDKATKRGIVQGYFLNPEEIQNLKELLSFKYTKIIPEPPAENYRLTFIPVEGGKYVVSVEIKPGDKKTYYGRDSSHMSYINTRVWSESLQQFEEVRIKLHDIERRSEDENDPRVHIDANNAFEFTFDESFLFKDVIIQNGISKEDKKNVENQNNVDQFLASHLCNYIGRFSDRHLMQLLGEFDKKEPYHALDIWCGLNNIEQLQSACIAKLQDLLQDSEKMQCEVEEG